ncbi:DUF6510 family protein [Actinomadura verrucosospora]|uniref:Uncharacterized protein n=1 Tax=Actinomadura verrucosospora TaxID=46165 RepID=A0A7D4A235_ACTVE|nr:DUF6510 family protein [Actinomadura verrucosospora]QKG18487.1 hypothetical protein ACTIVE_0121 [Actinomadura verrucosospora]
MAAEAGGGAVAGGTVPGREAVLYEDTGAYQDGNALAGPLSEVFGVDVTLAAVRCTECGLAGPLPGLHVYMRAPGAVARCPGCEHVVLRLVIGDGTAWLDLRGTVGLRVPLA